MELTRHPHIIIFLQIEVKKSIKPGPAGYASHGGRCSLSQKEISQLWSRELSWSKVVGMMDGERSDETKIDAIHMRNEQILLDWVI